MHLYIKDCCLLSNGVRPILIQIKMYFWYSEKYRSKVDLAGMLICIFVGPPTAVWCYSQRHRKNKKQINALVLAVLGSYSSFQLLAAMTNL